MSHNKLGRHFKTSVGLFLSIVACAVAIGAQGRSGAQREHDQGFMAQLGLESAWPQGRVDLSQ